MSFPSIKRFEYMPTEIKTFGRPMYNLVFKIIIPTERIIATAGIMKERKSRAVWARALVKKLMDLDEFYFEKMEQEYLNTVDDILKELLAEAEKDERN